MHLTKIIMLAVSLPLSTGHAADSSFLCKQINEDSSFIFSATTVITIDVAGNYGKPIDVTFDYASNGNTPIWTTLDGSTRFILMKEQIYVMDTQGDVRGKIVCE